MICPSSSESCIAAGTVRVSSPLGPFTVTTLPSWIVIVTPLVMGIGALPMRDMLSPPLPDAGEELAAGARLARLAVGHQPLRRGEDRDTEPVADARDLADPDVLAQARRGDLLQRADDGLPARGVLEPHAQQRLPILGLDGRVILDEVVLLQDPGDLGLHLRHRHVDAAVLRSAGVADPRQHVGDRVGHAHEFKILGLSYPGGRGGMSVKTCRAVRRYGGLAAGALGVYRPTDSPPNRLTTSPARLGHARDHP